MFFLSSNVRTTGTFFPPIFFTDLLFLFMYSNGLSGYFKIFLILISFLRSLKFFNKLNATGISSSGASVRETLMVSPIPSSKSAPIPTADFILPSSASPASVTPRCSG